MLEYSPRYGYVNDFTFAEKDGTYHLFHITGERQKFAFVDAANHIGHATSTDLIHWKQQPHVTEVSGACFCQEHQGRYALLSRLDEIAWSDNLFDWSPAEPVHFDYTGWENIYETPAAKNVERGVYFSPRDPFIWPDRDNDRYLMFFCTRVIDGDIHTRGCVGLAESTNLTEWKLLPPAFGPGLHLYPESPHVVDLGGKYHMFYSLSPEYGLRHAVADDLTGPYREVEDMDVLPGYLGASETLKVGREWYFFGRLVERTEYANANRLCQRSLSVPLKIEAGADDRIIFKALPFLENLRDKRLFDSTRDQATAFFHVTRGDWRTNRSDAMAANRYQAIPANSLYGSANLTPALVVSQRSYRNLDLEFDLQIPSFNGNDCQQRGGFVLDGVTFKLDVFQKALICQDAQRDVIAFKTLSLIKNDRYYHFRVFRADHLTQVYMDGELLMYLPAYGDGGGSLGFVVDHGDLIIKDISVWSLRLDDTQGFTLDDPDGTTMNGIFY